MSDSAIPTIDRTNIAEVALFLMNNVKSSEKVRQDVLSRKCYANILISIPVSVEALSGQFFEKVNSVTYQDGKVFYKTLGSEFHTQTAIEVFKRLYP